MQLRAVQARCQSVPTSWDVHFWIQFWHVCAHVEVDMVAAVQDILWNILNIRGKAKTFMCHCNFFMCHYDFFSLFIAFSLFFSLFSLFFSLLSLFLLFSLFFSLFLSRLSSETGVYLPLSLSDYNTFYFLTSKSSPRDLRTLRHLIRVMVRQTLTKKNLDIFLNFF